MTTRGLSSTRRVARWCGTLPGPETVGAGTPFDGYTVGHRPKGEFPRVHYEVFSWGDRGALLFLRVPVGLSKVLL